VQSSALSTEYVLVPVSAVEGGQAVDVTTADSIEMAFMSGTTAPGGGDWHVADWETDATTDPATYKARCLKGPDSDADLAPDDYAIWLRLTLGAETPVLRALGTLTVF
jgi:hypothetical protein